MTCARKHGIIDALAAARDHLIGLADLGYEGAADILRIPIKKIKGRLLTEDQFWRYSSNARGRLARLR
jgi:hypothetical protein